MRFIFFILDYLPLYLRPTTFKENLKDRFYACLSPWCNRYFYSVWGFWPQGMWDLSSPKPISPALKGKVLITGLPGKSLSFFLKGIWCSAVDEEKKIVQLKENGITYVLGVHVLVCVWKQYTNQDRDSQLPQGS